MKPVAMLCLALSLVPGAARPAAPGARWKIGESGHVRVWANWSGSDREIGVSVERASGADANVLVFRGTKPANDPRTHEPIRPAGEPSWEVSLEPGACNAITAASEIWVRRTDSTGAVEGTLQWEIPGAERAGDWRVGADSFDTPFEGPATSIGYTITSDPSGGDALLQVIRDRTYVEQTVIGAGAAVSGFADGVTAIRVTTLGVPASGTYALMRDVGRRRTGR